MDEGVQLLLTFLFPSISSWITKYDYKQIESGAGPISGSFNGDVPKASLDFVQFLKCLKDQAVYQHAKSCPIILGVPKLNNDKIIRVK